MSANTYYPSASATTAYPYRIDRGDNGAGDDNGHGTGDDNGHDAGHARSTRSNRGTELMDWCEQTVLPALFERLDRAFPEFHWTRCASGWNGYRPATQGRYVNPATDAVRCSQPWGYVEADGRLVSWLEYLNNGRRPRGREFAEVMQRLAQLAGVEIPASSADLHGAQSFAAENFAAEGSEPIKTTRQREILEAFVAYCKTALSHDHAGPARHFLRQTYGLDADHLADLPIGLYTSGRDVNDFLTGVGFTDAEVADSRVARDARLDHRIVLPWRDRFGRIRTCVAISPAGYPDPQSKRLYWKWKSTEDPLGGDIALRPGSLGLKNLVVTEGLIDVFVFHALGMTNVVSFGRAGKIPTAAQWREANPDADGNMRDHAGLEQLLVLANLENMNAELIHMNLPQSERLQRLNAIAIRQMQTLTAHSLKHLKGNVE